MTYTTSAETRFRCSVPTCPRHDEPYYEWRAEHCQRCGQPTEAMIRNKAGGWIPSVVLPQMQKPTPTGVHNHPYCPGPMCPHCGNFP